MKKILLVVLLGISLSGCATLGSMYTRAKDCVYPPEKPVVTETPAVAPAPPVAEPTIKIPEPKVEPTTPKAEPVVPKKKLKKSDFTKKKVDQLPFYTKERKKVEDDLQKEKAPAPPGVK
jgi:hypothetical protein